MAAVTQTGGFVGSGSPEALLQALRGRFVTTGHPRGLHLIEVAVTGDKKGAGVDELAVEGLVTKYTFGWTGNCPGIVRLIKAGKIEAWNLPLGIVSHMIRDAAANRPGPVTTIGLDTFVDPRQGGGKLGGGSQADAVKVVRLAGAERLFYAAPRVDVALLRGTCADVHGNVSMERECFFADVLYQAMAAHNNGGLVIIQVERIVAGGSIPTRQVHVPAALVDMVVVAPLRLHRQRLGVAGHDRALTGEVKAPLAALHPLPLGARKIIAHRCLLEFDTPNAIVNLGVGMPEGVAAMVSTHAGRDTPNALPITLSTEVGVVGGIPCAGQGFGAAVNAESVMPTSTMIDLIHGGGLDAAVLGCAEVDEAGNVNVSRFSERHPGCGGFIDISQSAKKVIFAGTFTGSGLEVDVVDGRLRILKEGAVAKFRRRVLERTFAGASRGGRPVLYVTERAVFRLVEVEGEPRVELTEVAPGARIEEDVLARMGFRPLLGAVRPMDARCFAP